MKNDDARVLIRFQSRLRELRMMRGESCTVASELCGFSKNRISKYESGEISPSLAAACRIANHYGVSLDELVGNGTKNLQHSPYKGSEREKT